jgi:hypothetical protein
MLLLLSLLFTLAPVSLTYGAAPDWVSPALRLTGESNFVRTDSIQKLRTLPGIETEIKQALRGERKFLALDVVSALKMENLMPELIQLSQPDESGFFYLAMNSLVVAGNQKLLEHVYFQRLVNEKTPPTVQMILLDSLCRMGVRLRSEDLEKFLFKNESPEVRASALYYLRFFLVHLGDADYLPLLREALEEKTPSDLKRVQLLYLMSELPLPMWRHLRGLRFSCPSHHPADLTATCNRLSALERL